MLDRRLGNSGLKVSEISLGSWISCNDMNEKDASFKVIEKAWECDINFFDTADAYSGGRVEIIPGEVLRKFPRESCILATKVYWLLGTAITNKGLSR